MSPVGLIRSTAVKLRPAICLLLEGFLWARTVKSQLYSNNMDSFQLEGTIIWSHCRCTKCKLIDHEGNHYFHGGGDVMKMTQLMRWQLFASDGYTASQIKA